MRILDPDACLSTAAAARIARYRTLSISSTLRHFDDFLYWRRYEKQFRQKIFK